MAYTKTEWKDQNVENPRTYLVRDNEDSTVTLMDAFGTVTELGTPVNAENMNKIENGIANAVDLDSAQDITGKKTFTNNVNPVVLKKSGDNTYTEIQLQDKNGIRQGGIRSIADSSQEQLTLYAASADGNSIIGSIGIAKDSNNGVKTVCPAPAASTDTSNTAIMTVGRAADPAQNFNLLHRSGDEIFSGVKTGQSNNPRFGFKNTLADISNKPSALTNSALFFADKNGLFTGEIRNEISTTGYSETALYTNSKISGTVKTSYIKIVVKENGEVYATCPTPPAADDNSTKISNTQWVNSRITSIMNSFKLDVAKKQTIENSFTAPSAGILSVINTGKGTYTVTIDGVEVARSFFYDMQDKTSIIVPIGAGQKAEVTFGEKYFIPYSY